MIWILITPAKGGSDIFDGMKSVLDMGQNYWCIYMFHPLPVLWTHWWDTHTQKMTWPTPRLGQCESIGWYGRRWILWDFVSMVVPGPAVCINRTDDVTERRIDQVRLSQTAPQTARSSIGPTWSRELCWTLMFPRASEKIRCGTLWGSISMT